MPLLKGRYEVTMKGEGRPAAAEVVGPGGALQTEILRSECAVLLFPYRLTTTGPNCLVLFSRDRLQGDGIAQVAVQS